MLTHRQTSVTLEIFKAVFIFLFVYTGLSKLLDFQTFLNTLHRSPLVKYAAPVFAILLPLSELMISFLLLLPSTLKYGLYAFFSLLMLFTLYIAYMLVFSPSLPCTCGGLIRYMSWPQHLVFNLVFLVLAGIAIRLYHTEKRYSFR
jgi:uncharacterized membrane protein YphA (DoxX/SURF4 family)